MKVKTLFDGDYLINDTLSLRLEMALLGSFDNNNNNDDNGTTPINSLLVKDTLKKSMKKVTQQVEGRIAFLEKREKELIKREETMKHMEDTMEALAKKVENKVILDVGMTL